MTPPPHEKRYWLDDLGNVRKVLWALYITCAVLATLDLFYDRHSEFAFEGWFGFFGVYGFVCCVLLVLAAKELRKLISRPEDYYDAEGGDDA